MLFGCSPLFLFCSVTVEGWAECGPPELGKCESTKGWGSRRAGVHIVTLFLSFGFAVVSEAGRTSATTVEFSGPSGIPCEPRWLQVFVRGLRTKWQGEALFFFPFLYVFFFFAPMPFFFFLLSDGSSVCLGTLVRGPLFRAPPFHVSRPPLPPHRTALLVRNCPFPWNCSS